MSLKQSKLAFSKPIAKVESQPFARFTLSDPKTYNSEFVKFKEVVEDEEIEQVVFNTNRYTGHVVNIETNIPEFQKYVRKIGRRRFEESSWLKNKLEKLETDLTLPAKIRFWEKSYEGKGVGNCDEDHQKSIREKPEQLKKCYTGRRQIGIVLLPHRFHDSLTPELAALYEAEKLGAIDPFNSDNVYNGESKQWKALGWDCTQSATFGTYLIFKETSYSQFAKVDLGQVLVVEQANAVEGAKVLEIKQGTSELKALLTQFEEQGVQDSDQVFFSITDNHPSDEQPVSHGPVVQKCRKDGE